MSLSVPRNLPVGYRFRPTDEELMNHFWRRKTIGGCSDVDDDIAEVDDVCMWDPWELRLQSKINSDDQICWFFSRRDPKSKRTQRKTKTGCWKITGKEQNIKGRDGRVIGKKKIVVFLKGPTASRGADWVIHEYHPLPENVLPNQRYYVICRLENKNDEKAGLPGCDESETSCDITSDVENSVAPDAISEGRMSVHGREEGNAESLLQQDLSPDDFRTLSDEDLDWILNNWLDNDHTQFTPEHRPETENSLLHQRPNLTHCLESKTDENTGTLGCNIGKPSGDIIAETEIPVTHTANSELSGYGEGNAKLLSQPVFSRDEYLSEEDIMSIFSVQKINCVMHEHHLELENTLPQQRSHLTCCLENKTGEKTGTLGCSIGRLSSGITSDISNQVAPTAIPVVDSSLNDDPNKWHALCGAAEPKMSPTEFSDGRKANPHENYNVETANNLFNDIIQPKSLKRPYFSDIPASNYAYAEGVDGRVKKPRSLALGE